MARIYTGIPRKAPSYEVFKQNMLERYEEWVDIVTPDQFDYYMRAIYHMIEIRVDAQLSQAQVGKIMGTAQGNVARFEAGKYLPSLVWMLRYADAVGCKLDLKVSQQPKLKYV